MLPLLLLATLQAPAARAEVKAGQGLGSRVNGVEGGSCRTGLCRIDGGSDSGRNRFHRLSRFDTRGAIQGVEIQSDGIRNLVLGVTAAEGSFIDKTVSLTAPAHLFLLSPGGIQLMPGGTFLQVPQLTLSTATQLHFPGGVFDVFSTPKADLSPLTGDPFSGRLGLRGSLPGEDRPWIRMDGIRIDVEESLLVDAPEGRIDITASQLSASNPEGDGGSITLTADLIKVGADSQLLATGQRNGGEVLVGGSWQNSDDTVRQAVQTWMQPGSLVDASSTGEGKGGTVVIWSDLNNPSGGTVAEGTFLATGGPLGGDGGRVETSGAMLIANPERVDVSSVNGLAGEWLLDPFDITISNDPGTVGADPAGQTNSNVLFTSTSSASTIDESALRQSLVDDRNNVRVVTGNGDPSQGGNITWQAGADLDYSAAGTKLTLDASGYIQLGSDITTGSGGLTLNAGAGFVEGTAGTNLILNGPLEISTGDVDIGTPSGGSQALASTLSGIGNLTKLGNGRLILSGNNASWEGNTTVSAGALRVTTSNALGDSAPTVVETGASLELSGIIALDEPITLEGGVLRNWSGNNTLKQTLTLNGSSTIDLKQDQLSLSPTTGDAVAVTPAGTAFNSDLTVTGDSDLVVHAPLSLKDGQNAYGDLVHSGEGVLRFLDVIYAEEAASIGGGTLWMNQAAEADIIEGPANSIIFLDNGSILRRDVNETVRFATLKIGPGGGGISVANGFTLIWDSAITGSGNFTKQGAGTLRFPVTAEISYTGDTLVKDGRLDVFSSSPATATCSGTGTSNLCNKSIVDVAVDTEEDSTLEALLAEAISGLSIFRPFQQSTNTSTDPYSTETGLGAPPSAQPQSSDPVIVVDLGSNSDDGSPSVVTASTTSTAASVQTVTGDQAVDQLRSSDQDATLRAASALGLEQVQESMLPSTPSVEELQTVLDQVESKRLAIRPAVLHVRFTNEADDQQGRKEGFLDLTLISAKAPVEARRVEVDRQRFAGLLTTLYRQLSRQEPLAVDNPVSPTRQLHSLLVAPLEGALQAQGIQTLLIAADQGLQAVPFAALNDGSGYFGDRYAFSLTPSLALTPLSPAGDAPQGQLALGASQFGGLAPLPLVPQELERIDASTSADRYLNSDFSPQVLLDRASDQRYSRVHVATHADFRPGGPDRSVLHTGTGPMSMAQFARLRNERRDHPLDLVVLSACRTLLGDKDSELGFAGLALQAGARSAIGTLWYVDDVVTSAFFVQFYHLLDQGLPKAQALQRTRQLFLSGVVQLSGGEVIGGGGTVLLNELTASQRRRIAGGVQNPFFWAGIELIGSPW